MNTISVLVLEDHPFQRAIAVNSLAQIGVARVFSAADGEAALARLVECGGVDIVLCDLRMSGMDGLGFLRNAAETGLINAVVLTSDVDITLRNSVVNMIECLGLPFLGDLGKPFLIEKLEGMLRSYEREQALRNATPHVVELASLEDIESGLQNHEFVPYFQPKYSLQNGQVKGAELLARWQHPERGLLSPAAFIPVMEEHGLLDQLFWQMLDQGLRLQRQLAVMNQPMPVAINLDASQLSSPQLAYRIKDALQEHKLPPGGLVLEVTETGLIEAPAESMENLLRLRLMGCGLAMDDFGVGYSSFVRICELPFDQIKLDASFVRNLKTHVRSEAIIRSVVALAASLQIELVAEGIETTEQEQRLLELGCAVGQGYLFARPMSAEQLLQRPWLASRQIQQ
ncbi:EAL domain-containing protein (putative c-di-GMP-specific phosphodiesterase class I) [Silvimonas terrae]|uniref:EAL domain-containing protein (Putative c-di-GMP-specific phosphodiesterase class I) n=1 Tax=Silvimonas terrae TaxID=300266 RepID=A0A840RHV5_9NEIS|nr:EAL domain-containing response regulator [Silvimonas terrae]MBB5191843.1 EAL domain-containing protein (putative c-di-GMP-specific phosphodiesterase class I) [Silvimonas terrae]